ncbi:serine/threonine-protein kinase [Hamadaea tsunoensis]|uniref:serine/threonine-protein kinase n=1 Tax=Hamadaea tsunoensis TaxID=53368 RepID=UPI000415A5B8|nr:serine/threonine-protein kinase [Hamadaea tsunoensis]
MSGWSVPGYSEVTELGRGASGRVVLATHDSTGVPVAVKYLADELKTDEQFLREFRAEARILAEVDDPNVSKLYEYIEEPGGAAIVMELVNGVALRKMLREQGPTEPEAALVVLKGSLLGLAAAHRHGVVHRDYKPENVLVDGEGRSKLADFGIAVRAGRTGPLAGTPSYMAPEQWAGGPATLQTDIYAATATFYECLTGAPPFRAPGDLALLRRQHESAPIPVDNVPEGVRGILRRGLAKDPGQRPSDAATFVRELDAVAGGAYGADWEENGKKKLARRALLLAALFPLALASLSGTAVANTGFGSGFSRLSSGVKKALLAGTTTVILVGGSVGGCVAFKPSNAADNTALPSSSPSVVVVESPSDSPSPLPSDSPSAAPSASTSPSAAPSASPKKSPKASPKASPKTSPSPSPSPACTPSGRITDTAGTGTISVYWGLASCAAGTVRVRVCGIQVDKAGTAYGTATCGSWGSFTVPAGAYSSKSSIDVTPLYNDCGSQVQIRLYLQTSWPKFNGAPTLVSDFQCIR